MLRQRLCRRLLLGRGLLVRGGLLRRGGLGVAVAGLLGRSRLLGRGLLVRGGLLRRGGLGVAVAGLLGRVTVADRSGLLLRQRLGRRLRVAVSGGLRLRGLGRLPRVPRCGVPALRRVRGRLGWVHGRLSRAERALWRRRVPGLPGYRLDGRLRVAVSGGLRGCRRGPLVRLPCLLR
nr:hypothetical protein [Streptomyces cynarae]